MVNHTSPVYRRLLDAIQFIPVIDCHEHLSGPEDRPPYKEPIAALIHGYIQNDLESAAFGYSSKDLASILDPDIPTDAKWPVFERLWRATEHTAYARVTKLVLKQAYGEDELTRQALDRVAARLAAQDEAAYFRVIEDANIRIMIVDVLGWGQDPIGAYLSGKKTFPDKWRLTIPLPYFHPTHFTNDIIHTVENLSGMTVTSLDEYLEGVYKVFQACIQRGAIAFKDQSAYDRSLDYELVSHAEAEKQFNQVLSDPRNSLGWPAGKPLNDFLFHQYMRFARQLDLPVQLHTGHMAGTYNRATKTNAALLTPVLEQHSKVRFDLFHGNWPYLGDLLFLGKNYPNVSLDLCWLHIIDPAYAIELMQRAVLTMPHTKIHAFGGDYFDVPEYVVAHLTIARQNIAAAMAGLVESGWLSEEQSVNLAKDWLYNNPNRFFRLGLPEI